jgi:hypothetical protein
VLCLRQDINIYRVAIFATNVKKSFFDVGCKDSLSISVIYLSIMTSKQRTNQMVAIQKYKVDTLDMGRGAFQALCDTKNVEIVRSGTTFGVGAFFPVLSLSHMVSRFYYSQNDLKNCDLSQTFENYHANIKRMSGGNKVKLILPSVEASQIVSIDRAVGLGGGSHEVGHIICDMAGSPLTGETAQKIIPVFKDFTEKKFNLFKVLGLWANVCADIRLEKMMSKLYPESAVRFHTIQEWVWNDLEAKSRLSGDMGKNPANAIALMIRDLGKDHKSKSQARVFNEYATLYPRLWECALSVKDLWKQLQVSIKEYTTFKKKTDLDKEILKTVHLPLTIAMQILMTLELPADKPKDNPPQDNPPKDNPPQDDQDQDNQDDNDDCNGGKGGDDDQDDQDPSNSDDDQDDDQDDDDQDDDQDSDDQDDNDQDSDDQDDDQDDDDQDDDQDSDDQDSDDQDSDDQDDDDQDDQDPSNSDDDQDDDDQDDDDQDDDQDDQDSDDQANDDQNQVSNQNTFDKNTTLDLESIIDPNDIAKAFQKMFDKNVKKLDHLPYISNGLKIRDIE